MLQCTKNTLKSTILLKNLKISPTAKWSKKYNSCSQMWLTDQLYIKLGNKVRIDVGGFVAISANNFNDVSSRRTPDSNSD